MTVWRRLFEKDFAIPSDGMTKSIFPGSFAMAHATHTVSVRVFAVCAAKERTISRTSGD